MLDSEGRRLNGIVKEIGEQSVKMDFNHPMAGANLYFSGKVTEVREANEDELTHGHVHSSGSREGCDKDDCHSKQHDHDHDLLRRTQIHTGTPSLAISVSVVLFSSSVQWRKISSRYFFFSSAA